ncbi:MAG TPA: hypothetical protein VFU21_21545 [Kofleriaceae bacterium]|nr:hypothetical protein [Kofleriaceae bacterium]
MLARTIRLTENLALLSLLTASSLAMQLAALRERRRARAELTAAWPPGHAEP